MRAALQSLIDRVRGEPRERANTEEARVVQAIKTQLQLAGERYREELEFTKLRLINPEGRFIDTWSVIMLMALLYASIVTPFEVAFITTTLSDGLFWFNRVVDLVFVVDMGFMFFLPYKNKALGTWEFSHRKIANNYFRTWFVIDVLSIIPFDVIGATTHDTGLQHAKALRLLRLLKLLRILRSARVFARLEQSITIKYATQKALKLSFGTLLLAHWIACLLGLIPSLEGNRWEDLTAGQNTTVNWYIGYFEGTLGVPRQSYNFWSIYLAGYYLAAMTVTTIGYGDVVPKTDAERGVMLLIMIAGAFCYAYAVGTVSNIVASMDAVKKDFHAHLDALNDYMNSEGVPSDVQRRVRTFWYFSLEQQRKNHYREVMQGLPETLRTRTAVAMNSAWVGRLPFLRSVVVVASAAPSSNYESFIAELSGGIVMAVFPPGENILVAGQHVDRLYMINKGCVMIHHTPYISSTTSSSSSAAARPRPKSSIVAMCCSTGMNEMEEDDEEDVSIDESPEPPYKNGGRLKVRQSVDMTNQEQLRKAGTMFGYETMNSSSGTCTYYATAMSLVELFTLTKEHLEACLEKFPEFREKMTV